MRHGQEDWSPAACWLQLIRSNGSCDKVDKNLEAEQGKKYQQSLGGLVGLVAHQEKAAGGVTTHRTAIFQPTSPIKKSSIVNLQRRAFVPARQYLS